MLTKSEELFEKYCKDNAIEYSRISTSQDKTPDYKIFVRDQTIIVEVKQIDLSKQDKIVLKELEQKKSTGHGGTPGDRVRAKIDSAAPQLAKLAKNNFSSIIVLFNNLPRVIGNPTEPYFIKVAMFGLQTLIYRVPKNHRESPTIAGSKFGPKRKLTKSDNTTISAVAVLEQNQTDDLSLEIYHNHFAHIPLPFGLFKELPAHEYRIPENIECNFQEWEEV